MKIAPASLTFNNYKAHSAGSGVVENSTICILGNNKASQKDSVRFIPGESFNRNRNVCDKNEVQLVIQTSLV